MTPSRQGDDPEQGSESIGALLARVRLASGRSQLRVAELLCATSGVPTVTRHEISRWEREERIPSQHWLRWLAVVLEVPLDELERAVAVARVDGGPVPRDAGFAAATGDGPAERLARLRRMDDLVGGVDLLPVVDRELTRALTTRAHRDRSVVAGLAQLTAWVAADAGDPVRARRAHRVGVRLAASAGDHVLAGHLLGALAHLGTALDPLAALALARQGYTVAAPRASARTRALLLHRVAFAAARAGERRHCEHALGAAERAYDRHVPGTDPPWLYWFDDAELIAMTGRCYAALGRPRLAEPLLRTGLGAGRIRLRSAALYSAWLARAHLDAGDVEQGCAVAGSALLTTVRVGSVRALRQITALHPRLGRFRTLPAVRDYTDRFDHARPYLPGGGGTGAARAG